MIPADKMPADVMVEGFHPGYERKGLYSLEEIFAELGDAWAIFDGDLIPVVSQRYQVFRVSHVCSRCGLVGEYFAKERSAKAIKSKKANEKGIFFQATTHTWHFNLYARNRDGLEVMMTKDHIVPRARGGTDDPSNLVTMCKRCNERKADSTQLHFGPIWRDQALSIT